MEAMIKGALHKLGVKSGKVRTVGHYGNVIVYLNGVYFGTYSPARKTFVD